MKLLGIIGVGFDVTDELLITFYASSDTREKNWEYNETVHQLFIDFKFKYLGMTVANQNLIEEKIKRRLNSGNICYHSVQNLLSSHLLSKNLKIRM
jgi:hypothetical protein